MATDSKILKLGEMSDVGSNIAATDNEGIERSEEDNNGANGMPMKDYFMYLAFLTAKRSKDPRTQVGACIVDKNNRVVSTGFNDMPTGCRSLSWERPQKYSYVCHAEMNAILNKNSVDIHGCTMYVSLFPCNECAKIIIQSGIAEVFYYSDKYKDEDKTKKAKEMLRMAEIPCTQYNPKDESSVTIKFRDHK